MNNFVLTMQTETRWKSLDSNQTLLRLQIYTLAIFCCIILTLPAAFHDWLIVYRQILVEKQL